jgi:hypothetical protein
MAKGCIFKLFLLTALINQITYSQETDAQNIEDEYNYFGEHEGITIYGEFPSDSVETNVLTALNGSLNNRKRFIENDLLRQSGFRSTANVRYRKTDSSEKALATLHIFANVLSFGIVPKKPFSEIEYGRLPKGQYYSFESVFISSQYTGISPIVLAVMEIEYILQIEFFNGIIIQENISYYTEKNINKFERLILQLPDSPESIMSLKKRYLNIELPKIKNAFERYNNPSENYIRAQKNLENMFRRSN